MFQILLKFAGFLFLGTIAFADDSSEPSYELVDNNSVQECVPFKQLTRCSPLFGCEVIDNHSYKRQCEFDDGFWKIIRFIEANSEAYSNEDIDEMTMTMFEMSLAVWDLEQLVESVGFSEKVYDDYYRDYLELQAGKPNLIERISKKTGIEGDIITTLSIVEQHFNSLSKSERQEIQLVLKARGLYQSDIDGIWGRGTRIAFALYLAPAMEASSADNVYDLMSEVKRGFVIENLWTRENYEKELRQIWSTNSRANILSDIKPSRRAPRALSGSASDLSNGPFVKSMQINGELKICIKVGNSWDCD